MRAHCLDFFISLSFLWITRKLISLLIFKAHLKLIRLQSWSTILTRIQVIKYWSMFYLKLASKCNYTWKIILWFQMSRGETFLLSIMKLALSKVSQTRYVFKWKTRTKVAQSSWRRPASSARSSWSPAGNTIRAQLVVYRFRKACSFHRSLVLYWRGRHFLASILRRILYSFYILSFWITEQTFFCDTFLTIH